MKSALKSKLTAELKTDTNTAPEADSAIHKTPVKITIGKWGLIAMSLGLASFMLFQSLNAAPPAETIPPDHKSLLGIAQSPVTQPILTPQQTQSASPVAKALPALKAPARESAPVVAPLVTTAAMQPLLGSYVGDFAADESVNPNYTIESYRINLAIDGIQDGKISGHSVVAGIKRPFTGTISPAPDGSFSIIANEPGSHPFDGTFSFKLHANTVTGKWQANNQHLSGRLRNYELNRQDFKYDPSVPLSLRPRPYDYTVDTDLPQNYKQEGVSEDAGKYNASTVRLTSAIVENMYRRDLEVMRNSIYARHGYVFQDPILRRYFETYPWYMPVSLDVSRDLTSLEQANISLIQRYERHATRYYDHFGR